MKWGLMMAALKILEPEYQRELLEEVSELQNWFLHQTDMNDEYCRAVLGRTTTLLLDLQQFCEILEFSRIKV